MDAQVIVVGAGPVGLMLAAELRLGGADVLVVERLAKPMTESRASTLHARTMEILDQRGLLERLGTPPSTGKGHFGGLTLDLSQVETPYPGQWKVPQARVEHLLEGWAVELGVRIRRGYDVQDLAVSADHVEVRGPDGACLRSAYVVGCDGEESSSPAAGRDRLLRPNGGQGPAAGRHPRDRRAGPALRAAAGWPGDRIERS